MKKNSKASLIFYIILAVFIGKQFQRIYSLGPHFNHVDGFSEDHSREGARNFIQNGFAYSGGLSVWPRFDQDTDIPLLKERKIYTHYYPGPDWILTIPFLIFGESDFIFQWSRLIPLFFVLFSFLLHPLLRATPAGAQVEKLM